MQYCRGLGAIESGLQTAGPFLSRALKLEEGPLACPINLGERASKLFTVLFLLRPCTCWPKGVTTGSLDFFEVLLELLALLGHCLDLAFQLVPVTLPSS
jgi:hypothetical protein